MAVSSLEFLFQKLVHFFSFLDYKVLGSRGVVFICSFLFKSMAATHYEFQEDSVSADVYCVRLGLT